MGETFDLFPHEIRRILIILTLIRRDPQDQEQDNDPQANLTSVDCWPKLQLCLLEDVLVPW